MDRALGDGPVGAERAAVSLPAVPLALARHRIGARTTTARGKRKMLDASHGAAVTLTDDHRLVILRHGIGERET
jgi:hypothetical protein